MVTMMSKPKRGCRICRSRYKEAKRPIPIFPTCALPGTEAKIRIMRERAERGEQLHHPRDARSSMK